MPAREPTSDDEAAVAVLRALHRPDGTTPPLIGTALVAGEGLTLANVFEATTGVVHSGRAAPTLSRRRRFAGVVVGAIGEQEFERRYNEIAASSKEFTLADKTKEGTDTDFLTADTLARPAFRINVKSYGARFDKAKTFVGLEPEDTFGVATYKVRAAVRKSQREALPYLFAIVSATELRADAVAERLPPAVSHLLDTSTLYVKLEGWKTIEDRLVDLLLQPTGYGGSEVVEGLRRAIRAAEWRIISAIKANHLMNEKLDERVPAVSNPEFKVAPNSQPNMHFSLNSEMISLEQLLELLRTNGIQHVATKIAYNEI
jgi:hypothetical protein